jgi:hypothetical protein
VTTNIACGRSLARFVLEPEDYEKVQKYSEDQERDEHGRWTAGGGDMGGPGGTTYRETPRDKEINKAPEGSHERWAANWVKDMGKDAIKNNATLQEAREKAAWAQGRIERLDKQIATQSNKVEKINKELDRYGHSLENATPQQRSAYDAAMKETEALLGRQGRARDMLNDSNEQIKGQLEQMVHEGFDTGGKITIGTNELSPADRAAVEEHLSNFERMIGGAPKGGNGEVNFKYMPPEDEMKDRAYYRSSTNAIYFGDKGVDRSTLFHEMGHWYEDQSTSINSASQNFLANRTYGEAAQKMSDITGHPGYKDYEVARPDEFIRAYTGKDYGPFGSEVLSMGFQYMSSNPSRFMREDPDHFYFTVGAIRLGHSRS